MKTLQSVFPIYFLPIAFAFVSCKVQNDSTMQTVSQEGSENVIISLGAPYKRPGNNVENTLFCAYEFNKDDTSINSVKALTKYAYAMYSEEMLVKIKAKEDIAATEITMGTVAGGATGLVAITACAFLEPCGFIAAGAAIITGVAVTDGAIKYRTSAKELDIDAAYHLALSTKPNKRLSPDDYDHIKQALSTEPKIKDVKCKSAKISVLRSLINR